VVPAAEFDDGVDGGGMDLGEVEIELGFWVSGGAEWRLGLIGGADAHVAAFK